MGPLTTTLDELAAVESWLFDKLLVLNYPVYSEEAPEDAPYPFILFAHLDAKDVFGVGTARFLTRADYVVRGCDRTESAKDVYPLAVAIDNVLHGVKGVAPIQALMVLSCVRNEPFRQREVQDDIVYLSRGGIYRIQVQGGTS